MEGGSSIHIDVNDSNEEIHNQNHASIGTLWGGVSAWREQMLLLATEYASSKQKYKNRNRDIARADYIKTLTDGRDSECISQLRMDTSTFTLLCQSLRDKKLLKNTRQVCVEEVVAEFMHTIAHSVRNRTNSVRFFRSGETISRHVQEVLYAINRLAPEWIVQASPHTPKGPYGFEDCVGALDGTHVPVRIPTKLHGSFRNRKGVLSQNVLGACGFDMNFQYVLPRWEGSAANARVLQNALFGEDPLIMPQGKFYLVDAGYANAPGFLAPYRAVRYHLSKFRGMNPQNENELFNKRHSQARNVIERTFGVLKSRFGILKTATQYEYRDQVSIVVACCVMHNFIRAHYGDFLDGLGDTLENDNDVNTTSNDYDDGIPDTAKQPGGSQACPLISYSQRERDDWHSFRDSIAARPWNDYCRDEQ